jgi:hypothetical protein
MHHQRSKKEKQKKHYRSSHEQPNKKSIQIEHFKPYLWFSNKHDAFTTHSLHLFPLLVRAKDGEALLMFVIDLFIVSLDTYMRIMPNNFSISLAIKVYNNMLSHLP